MPLEQLLGDLTSSDEVRAEAAAQQLAAREAEALPWLAGLLQSSDVDARWWSIRTLAQMKCPQPELIRGGLDDPSVEVRAAAALALVSHPDERAVPTLISMLNGQDDLSAILASKALMALGSTVVPALLEAYAGADLRARIYITRTLAGLKDHRAIRTMMDAIGQDSAALHYWAQQGLEALGLDMVYLRPD